MVEVVHVTEDSLVLRIDGQRKAFVGFVDSKACLIDEQGGQERISLQRFGELLQASGHGNE